jgi:hypothetical protein
MIFSRFSIDFLPLGNPINIDALRAATPLLLYSLEICCSKEFFPLCIGFLDLPMSMLRGSDSLFPCCRQPFIESVRVYFSVVAERSSRLR